MGSKKNDSSGSESDAEMEAVMMDECDDMLQPMQL